jgi:hypothetical protein
MAIGGTAASGCTAARFGGIVLSQRALSVDVPLASADEIL